MKYTLMRHYFSDSRNFYILDLYNVREEKGIELHYYLKGRHKFNIEKLRQKLEEIIFSDQSHLIDWWDDLVRQYQE